MRVPRSAHAVIAERIEAGEMQAQVAADYGVSQQQVSKIVAKEKEKQERQKKADAYEASTNGKAPYRLILTSVEALHEHIEPETIDVIITDPPYELKSLSLYTALGRQGASLLRSGGSLFVMTGQSWLPEVFSHLATLTRSQTETYGN